MDDKKRSVNDFLSDEVGNFLPTMKINPTEDSDDIPFKECSCVIKDLRLINTANGDKVIMSLSDENDEEFDIFVNKTSLGLLKEHISENSNKWIDSKVELTKKKDPKFKKEMILVTPVD